MNDPKPFLEKILELEELRFIKDIAINQEDSRIDIYLVFRLISATGNCNVHDRGKYLETSGLFRCIVKYICWHLSKVLF